jgi:hypothetical protein
MFTTRFRARFRGSMEVEGAINFRCFFFSFEWPAQVRGGCPQFARSS